MAAARPAFGQACCASAGLVIPSRLRSYEDAAVGLQARGRSVFGAFDPAGGYRGAGAGESEWGFGQDLFGAVRLLDRGQLALLVPFVETRRAVAGTSSAGGGLGDVAVDARYDLVNSGERHPWPGVAVLAGVVLPTGTPPEAAGDALAAGATGQGSTEATVGLGLEWSREPYFVGATAAVGLRTARRVLGVRQTFAPRFTGLLAVGRTLPRGTTAGVFATALRQGRSSDDDGPIAGSDVLLMTVGAAATLSPSDHWRIQGALSTNAPVDGTGRNLPAGVALSLSLMRLWL